MTHVYGLTEVYGPAVVNEWHAEWDALDPQTSRRAKAPPGRALSGAGSARRCSTRRPLEPVPADGKTLGEVMLRGNIVMKGYLKNPTGDARSAFKGGWFHTGDLGVMHPDGYIQLKDRSKDIIISGGENISSIEVEDALYQPPGGAGGGRGRQAGREMGRDALRLRRAEARHEPRRRSDIVAYCREHLAHYKCPRTQ